MLNLRQLAAVDMALHGARLMLVEFGVGVFLPLGLGLLFFVRGHGGMRWLLGTYLVLIALNYVPLLIFSLRLRTRENAEEEIADLLNDRAALVRLSKQSLFLLMPILPLVSTPWFRKDR